METTAMTTLALTEPLQPQPATVRPIVIGLDTSLTATGIASSTGWCEVVGYTDKKNPITKLSHTARFKAMRAVRRDILLSIGCPDLVVLETPALSRTGGGSHERGWLWWSLYGYLIDADIPVGLVSTNQRMLYATGKGAATKAAVVDAVARRWPAWTTEGDDNLADAVVLMAAGRDHLGHPITDMPKTHRAALDKAIWPDLQVTQ
jgi:crossover junction endodeoxyribonuclease RuvC